MILTIEFTPRQEAWLAEQAVQQGIVPAEIVKMLVDEHLSPTLASEETDSTLALFAHWQQLDSSPLNSGQFLLVQF